MNACEVMLEAPVVLSPDMDVLEAVKRVQHIPMDIIPIVDASGQYHGAVQKAALLDEMEQTSRIRDVCCQDALVCEPMFSLEHLKHDACTPIPHQTIMVVDDAGVYRGVIPFVHWAVDEAKTQSGHPRSDLGVRTVSMHLTYRCTECGELVMRNSGVPEACPVCGANAGTFALYTED